MGGVVRLCFALFVLCAAGRQVSRASTILSLSDTGQPGWVVSGGLCPPGSGSLCPAGVGLPFSQSDVYVPLDQGLFEPIPGLGFWNVAPHVPFGLSLGEADNSIWVAPSVRESDGTIAWDDVLLDMEFEVTPYTFQTTFLLNGIEALPGNSIIYGQIWADGRLMPACGIRLNGNDATCVAGTEEIGPSYADLGQYFSFNSGFVTGNNVIEFFVRNGGHETGMRGDLEGIGNLDDMVPEPLSIWLAGAGLAGIVLLKRRRAYCPQAGRARSAE